MSNLILNNPRAAFWVVSAFWFIVAAIPWGILFSILGYKVRCQREPDETKALKQENVTLKKKVFEQKEKICIYETKIKGAQLALGPTPL